MNKSTFFNTAALRISALFVVMLCVVQGVWADTTIPVGENKLVIKDGGKATITIAEAITEECAAKFRAAMDPDLTAGTKIAYKGSTDSYGNVQTEVSDLTTAGTSISDLTISTKGSYVLSQDDMNKLFGGNNGNLEGLSDQNVQVEGGNVSAKQWDTNSSIIVKSGLTTFSMKDAQVDKTINGNSMAGYMKNLEITSLTLSKTANGPEFSPGVPISNTLESVVMPKIGKDPNLKGATVGKFEGFKNLKTVDINTSASGNIPDNAFKGCTSLKSVKIMSTEVTRIGNNAFEGCIALTKVDMMRGVEVIGNAAFKSCTALSNVSFSAYVKTIEANAFLDCIKIKSLKFPSNVDYIGEHAFGFTSDEMLKQSELTDIYLFGETTKCSQFAFNSVHQEDDANYIGDFAYNSINRSHWFNTEKSKSPVLLHIPSTETAKQNYLNAFIHLLYNTEAMDALEKFDADGNLIDGKAKDVSDATTAAGDWSENSRLQNQLSAAETELAAAGSEAEKAAAQAKVDKAKADIETFKKKLTDAGKTMDDVNAEYKAAKDLIKDKVGEWINARKATVFPNKPEGENAVVKWDVYDDFLEKYVEQRYFLDVLGEGATPLEVPGYVDVVKDANGNPQKPRYDATQKAWVVDILTKEGVKEGDPKREVKAVPLWKMFRPWVENKEGDRYPMFFNNSDAQFEQGQGVTKTGDDEYKGWRKFLLSAPNLERESRHYDDNRLQSRWYSMCFPFFMTWSEIENAFGPGTKICQFRLVEENTDSKGNITTTFYFDRDISEGYSRYVGDYEVDGVIKPLMGRVASFSNKGEYKDFITEGDAAKIRKDAETTFEGSDRYFEGTVPGVPYMIFPTKPIENSSVRVIRQISSLDLDQNQLSTLINTTENPLRDAKKNYVLVPFIKTTGDEGNKTITEYKEDAYKFEGYFGETLKDGEGSITLVNPAKTNETLATGDNIMEADTYYWGYQKKGEKVYQGFYHLATTGSWALKGATCALVRPTVNAGGGDAKPMTIFEMMDEAFNGNGTTAIVLPSYDENGKTEATKPMKWANRVMNLQGQVVREGTTSLKGLGRGVYVVNGKKYVVK